MSLYNLRSYVRGLLLILPYILILASLLKDDDPQANLMKYYGNLEALKKLKKFFAG